MLFFLEISYHILVASSLFMLDRMYNHSQKMHVLIVNTVIFLLLKITREQDWVALMSQPY